MSKPHKWAKQIKAWADGAEIQMTVNDEWVDCIPSWEDSYAGEYRIKPQPKEPKYMYVLLRRHDGQFCLSQVPPESHPANAFSYIGKIKLEDEDV